MVEGMLWFDRNVGHSLEEELECAAAAYQDKYGVRPNVCYMHPSKLFAGLPMAHTPEINGIYLYESNSVLLEYFWLAQEDTRQPTAA